MRNDLTDITVILDGSGSMGSILDATIEGFNAFLAAQQKEPGDVRLTVIKFDSTWLPDGGRRQPVLEYLARAVDIKQFGGLTRSNYIPRGGTPLYYAQSVVIDQIGDRLAATPEAERPGKVMIATLTDGGDTDERSLPAAHSRAAVRAKTEHQRTKYAWDFTYLGANQDAEATAESMGILRGKAMNYGANDVQTRSAFASVSNYTRTIRGTAVQDLASVGYTDEDRAAQQPTP